MKLKAKTVAIALGALAVGWYFYRKSKGQPFFRHSTAADQGGVRPNI